MESGLLEILTIINRLRRDSEGMIIVSVCSSLSLMFLEGITVSKQSQVMAQVTYQALFRSFPKLCGMTGTAMTDANELESIYGLQVVQVRYDLDRDGCELRVAIFFDVAGQGRAQTNRPTYSPFFRPHIF